MANEQNGAVDPGNAADNNKVPPFIPGKADESIISLSQAILAPLDALFKAQVHAARSFLNLILQIGYPDIRINNETQRPEQADLDDEKKNKPFYIPFSQVTKDVNGKDVKFDISIPALALIPFNALAIDSGEFKFGMNITYIDNHQQMQESRNETNSDKPEKSPWFLVKDPVSMKGNIASRSDSKSEFSQGTSIDISIKVSKSPVPAALDNLLTYLTQQSSITNRSNPEGQ